MLDQAKNFAISTVSLGYDASATSIVLTTGEGALFPDPAAGAFNLIWYNSTDYQNPSLDPNKEIVRCTAKTGDTLTITRAQEGTSASTKNTADKIYKVILGFTAKMRDDIQADISARVVLAGVSGGQTIVGGTGVEDALKYKGTSGNGTLTSIAHQWLVGNNGATVAMTILNSGNVGIGTTGPGAKLEVIGADDLTTSYAAKIGGATTVGLVIKNTGSVGIGTASPSYPLDVNGTARATTLVSTSNSTIGGVLTINGIGNTTIAGNVGIGTTSPGAKLDVRGAIMSGDGTIKGGISYSAYPVIGALSFHKLAIYAGGAEKVTIDTAGNVGIGTTGPTAYLHLKAGTATANTAPIKLTAGVVNTTPEAGAIEFDGTDYFLTI